MENNSVEEKRENDIVNQGQNIVSDERKMTIIDLMFVKRKGVTFSSNRDSIKGFPLLLEEEKEFVDKVYQALKDLNIDEDVLKVENVEALKEELYNRCQIPKEVVQQVKQKGKERAEKLIKDIEKSQREWAEMDAQRAEEYDRREASQQDDLELQVLDGGYKEEEKAKNIGYKEDLYQPDFLCGRAIGAPDKPYVELARYSKEKAENNATGNTYQFSDRTYTIKKTGKLHYMSTPNLQDSLSEYEITIARGDMSRTVRRFGEISLNKMDDPAYSTVVFLQLLGPENLTDKELHGYLGSLEQVQDKHGNLKNEYKIVYLPEEYTAVAVWEEIEKGREERRKRIEEEKIANEGEKASGGDAR